MDKYLALVLYKREVCSHNPPFHSLEKQMSYLSKYILKRIRCSQNLNKRNTK